VSPVDCEGIFPAAVSLLSRVHTRKSVSGKKMWSMGVCEEYEPYWDDLSELWFLGMQSKCHPLSGWV